MAVQSCTNGLNMKIHLVLHIMFHGHQKLEYLGQVGLRALVDGAHVRHILQSILVLVGGPYTYNKDGTRTSQQGLGAYWYTSGSSMSSYAGGTGDTAYRWRYR